MPTTWKLRYRLLTEDAQHTCRHHLTALQHDANVYSVTFTRDIGQDHAILDVVFNDGVDQPATPELQALNHRYPASGILFFTPEDYAVVGPNPGGIQPGTLFTAGRRSGRSLYQQFYSAYYNDSVAAAIDLHQSFPISMGTTVSVSHEFGVAAWRQTVPTWAQPHVYAKETATGMVVQIEESSRAPRSARASSWRSSAMTPG